MLLQGKRLCVLLPIATYNVPALKADLQSCTAKWANCAVKKSKTFSPSARENPDFSQPPSYWQSEAKNYRAPSQLYSDGGAHTHAEKNKFWRVRCQKSPGSLSLCQFELASVACIMRRYYDCRGANFWIRLLRGCLSSWGRDPAAAHTPSPSVCKQPPRIFQGVNRKIPPSALLPEK